MVSDTVGSIHKTIHPHIVITEAPQPEHQLVSSWLARAGKMSNDDEAAVLPLAQSIKEYAPNGMVERQSDDDGRVMFVSRLAEQVPSVP